MKDQDVDEFEEPLQFHNDGVNVDQDGEINLEQTNLDFDVLGNAYVPDKGPGPELNDVDE